MQARVYDQVLREHLRQHRQMIFLSGPRQVGKTTSAKAVAAHYLNADVLEDRRDILAGPRHLAARLGLDQLRKAKTVVALDEIHKLGTWKRILKGFFDLYEDRASLLVTGSARLEVFKKGGDSLMGRYLPYRMHPFSLGELLDPGVPAGLWRRPRPVPASTWEDLQRLGGFPEPLLKGNAAFATAWRRLRSERLLKEDLRDLSGLRDLSHVELLAQALAANSGKPVIYATLSRDLGAGLENLRRWVATLTSLHYGFLVRPWFKSVRSSLRKEPKWYLRDWSGINDPGARAETLVANALLKTAELFHDLGRGDFALHYLRDKQKREVDFLMVKDGKPWLMVEVKAGQEGLSPALRYFADALKPAHALQANFGTKHVEADCFAAKGPMVVPATSLLAQLV